mgnify:CR=1 FL=1|tara:strand:- start:9537 stop:10277 length:741 start_codon:yes stop_codon:yes gene_type:complete
MTKMKIINLEPKDKVKMLTYNRPVNRALVNKLKESMKKYGVLSSITIYQNDEETLVVDGQHRWTAASELGLSVPAISISWDAMDAIVEMNTIQVNWTMANFVDFFSVHKNPEIKKPYALLKKKHEEHPYLTYGSLSKLYGKPNSNQAFKEGKWRLTGEDKGDVLVSWLKEIVDYLPYAYTERFISAYKVVAEHTDYSHKRMMRKLKSKHNIEVLTTSNPKSYGIMLTKIYNFNQKKDMVLFKSTWI